MTQQEAIEKSAQYNKEILSLQLQREDSGHIYKFVPNFTGVNKVVSNTRITDPSNPNEPGVAFYKIKVGGTPKSPKIIFSIGDWDHEIVSWLPIRPFIIKVKEVIDGKEIIFKEI